MFDNNLSELCVFYCLTPLHAGAGQATGAIDLPIQRERHTAWPQVQSSGVKGAFRDWFYRYQKAHGAKDPAKELTQQVFGSEESGDSGSGQAGAISFSDARLLAFPVRSNVAPFVWVTCPAVLDRLNHDLLLVSGLEPFQIASPEAETGFIVKDDGSIGKAKQVIMEDMCIDLKPSPDNIKSILVFLEKQVPRLTRLILIADSDYSYLVRTSTEVQPQIKIDIDTGTAQDGSLRYEELLPSDSVLYSLVFFSNEKKRDSNVLAEIIKGHVKDAIATHIQMGGDVTLGRGLMEVKWSSGPAKSGGDK